MANLKVKPLQFWMLDRTHEELLEEYEEMPDNLIKVGRDGFYCFINTVWFEVDSKAYFAYRSTDKAREYFCYDLTVNDEAILTKREEDAMVMLLKTCRDSAVRKVVSERLYLHRDAKELRDTGRRAQMTANRLLKPLRKQRLAKSLDKQN